MSAAYRVLVVDDEPPARSKVVRLLGADPRFQLVGEARDGGEALRNIEVLLPDLVILDVQMPVLNGFEVLHAVGPERRFVVVFSTAHDEHALRAFNSHAVDYLLKPYDAERFRRALDKASAQLAAGERPDLASLAASGAPDRLVVKTGGGWVALPVATIVRVAAAGKHVAVFVDGERRLVRQTLTSMLARLDPKRFARVHRSDVVRVDAVAKIEPWTHGDAILTLSDGSSTILSRTYRRKFLELYSGFAPSTE